MNMVASFLDWILQLTSTVKTMNKNVASFTLFSILKIGVLVGGIITLTIMLLSFSAVSHFSLHKLRSTRLSLKNVDQVARWHGNIIPFKMLDYRLPPRSLGGPQPRFVRWGCLLPTLSPSCF